MKRKLLRSLAIVAMALMCGNAWAEEYNGTSAVYCPELGQNYTDLNTAFTGIYSQTEKTTITLELYKSVTLSGRLTVNLKNSDNSTSATITQVSIVPKEDNLTISKGSISNTQWFLSNKNGATFKIGSTDKVLTIQGPNASSGTMNRDVFRAEGTSTIMLENVVVKDFSFTSYTSNNITYPACIFSNKAAQNTFIMKNVEFNNCKAVEGEALIKYNVDGTKSYNDVIYLRDKVDFVNCSGTCIETPYRIRLGEEGANNNNPSFEASSVITIKWTGTRTIGNSVLAKGAKKSTLFTLVNEDLGLYASTDLKLTQAYTVETNSKAKGAATLVLPFTATIPDGVTAFKLNSVNANSIVTEKVDNTLDKNTPVLINTKEDGGKYKFVSTAQSGDAETGSGTHQSGLLTGVYEETSVPANSYILGTNSTHGVGFYKVSSDNTKKVNAYHAYLTLTQESTGNTGAATPAFFSIIIGDEGTTAIKGINVEENNVENGIYNLNGVRMQNTNKKGLYIINGKKVTF